MAVFALANPGGRGLRVTFGFVSGIEPTFRGNTALVFAGIITIAATGLVLDTCLRGLLILADPSRRR